uniref:Uncharacterized protein n=1 Tax=Anguilla anguilla TaxID=7936 RepID=A0A0E9RK28_ANGAN
MAQHYELKSRVTGETTSVQYIGRLIHAT